MTGDSTALTIMLPAAPAAFDYKLLAEPIATELQSRAARIRGLVKSTTAGLIEIGRDLLAAKDRLDHGQFTDWVFAECRFSVRTARNYMALAKFAEGKTATVALLPPATAYRLAAKSAPPELVNAVIERTESGTLVSDQEVVAALDDLRHQRREAERKAQTSRSRRHRKLSSQSWEEEHRLQREDEKARAKLIIDAIGEGNARRVFVEIIKKDDFRILLDVRNLLVEEHPVARDLERVKEPATAEKSDGLDDSLEIPAFLRRDHPDCIVGGAPPPPCGEGA